MGYLNSGTFLSVDILDKTKCSARNPRRGRISTPKGDAVEKTYWFSYLKPEDSWLEWDTNKQAKASYNSSVLSFLLTRHKNVTVQNEIKEINIFQPKPTRDSGNVTQDWTEELPFWSSILFPFLSASLQTGGHPKLSPISSVWAGPSYILLTQCSCENKPFLRVSAVLLQYYKNLAILKLQFL